MQPTTPLEPIREPEPGAAPAPAHGVARPLIAAAITTAAVTVISYAAPRSYAGTGVGLAFLAATWILVLRHDDATIRAHGLSLGGLLEPAPIAWRRLARDAAESLAWAALLAAITFPPFWYGYKAYWGAAGPFALRWPLAALVDEVAAQFLVVALPEEAFFRGYLQSALDRAAPRMRVRVLGAELGVGWLASAAIFAVGHVLTIRHPSRLAVFFPALLFGWLRARTGGIGAPLLFHAACNLFSATLARGYGLSP